MKTVQVYDFETYNVYLYNTLGGKQTSRCGPEGEGSLSWWLFCINNMAMCYTFKPRGHDFSENSFENDKILHNNGPQQLFLEILGTI